VLKRVSRSGGYQYEADWRDSSGKRRRKLLGSDKRVAERVLADIIRRRDLEIAGLEKEDLAEPVLDVLVGEYLVALATRAKPVHVKGAKTAINRVLEFLGASRVRDISASGVGSYLAHRTRMGAANRTANIELAHVRAMLNWAKAIGHIREHELGRVRKLPEGKAHQTRKKRALSESEVGAFLKAVSQRDEELAFAKATNRSKVRRTKGSKPELRVRAKRIPQAPVWLTLIETGGRWGEVTATCWGDYDAEGMTITFRVESTKSEKALTVPVGEALGQSLDELRAAQGEVLGRIPHAGEFLFLTPTGRPWQGNRDNGRREFGKLLELAGIERVNSRGESVTIHSLRHTAASRLARSGVSIIHAQKLLGHSDPRLTAEVYTHVETEELRDALRSVPKLGAYLSLPPRVARDGVDPGLPQVPQPQNLGVGTPDRIRTCDLPLRRRTLYPAELRAPEWAGHANGLARAKPSAGQNPAHPAGGPGMGYKWGSSARITAPETVSKWNP